MRPASRTSRAPASRAPASGASACQAAACAAGFGLLALAVARCGRGRSAGLVTRVDDRVLNDLSGIRKPQSAVRAARIVSALGDPQVAWPMSAALAWLGSAARQAGPARAPDRPIAGRASPTGPAVAAAIAVAEVAAGAAARRLLCEIMARPRPPERYWLARPEGYSFPSKHTTLAVLALGAGTAGYPRRARRAAAAAAVAVGLSRVYLGIHWPSDVAGGWLLGVAWLAAAGAAEPRRPALSRGARPHGAFSSSTGICPDRAAASATSTLRYGPVVTGLAPGRHPPHDLSSH